MTRGAPRERVTSSSHSRSPKLGRTTTTTTTQLEEALQFPGISHPTYTYKAPHSEPRHNIPDRILAQQHQEIISYTGSLNQGFEVPAAFHSTTGTVTLTEKLEMGVYNHLFGQAEALLVQYGLEETNTDHLIRAITQAIGHNWHAQQDEAGREAYIAGKQQEDGANKDISVLSAQEIRARKLEVCVEMAAIAYYYLHDMHDMPCTLCFAKAYGPSQEAHAYVGLGDGSHFHANSPSREGAMFHPHIQYTA